MYGHRDPSRQRVFAWTLISAPLVVGLIAAVVHHHPAAYAALIAGAAAAGGGLMLKRTIEADLDEIARRVEALGETGEVDGPAIALLSGRQVTAAATRVIKGLIARAERAEWLAAVNEGVVEQLPDPLVVCDRDRQITRANHAARALLGDRLAGRNLSGAIRAPDVLKAADAVLAGAASKEVEFTTGAPVERTFGVRIRPFKAPVVNDAGGDQRNLIITLNDITTIRRADQMRADFIANASHELRTPLASLTGFIETLLGPARDDGEARGKFLVIMRDQAGRMSRLVDDLLSLSRIEQDEHMPPASSVDVAALTHATLDSLRLKAAERDVTLKLVEPTVPSRVMGDADQIIQVIQNLVTNAIKYGRKGGEVTVTLSLVEGGVMGVPPSMTRGSRRGSGVALSLAVADQGEGIPKTHLPRLTERFYRVDPARSRALGGTGLGLAIVKHIVNRHGGRLTIDSVVGQGSVFTAFFPVLADGGVVGIAGRDQQSHDHFLKSPGNQFGDNPG